MRKLPFVSLLMPIRNEAEFIGDALQAVLAQDYPASHIEVIVADGISTDGTQDVVRKLSARCANLRLIANPGRIVSTGLNAALREARGEIIIRIDGHCEIAPDYVSRCVEHLMEEDIDGVGGPIETIGETFGARAIALAMSSPFGVGGAAFRTVKDRKMLVETLAFPAYRRQAIEKAGLFDEELVRDQDDEYNYRLRKLGCRLLLAPDISSRYYSRSSLRSLWRQYFQYGFWKVRVMQKHPRQMRARQFVPALFVASLLLTLLVSAFFPVASGAFFAVAGAYLCASLAASLMAASKANWKLLPALPPTFATLHLAYGFGFLFGLIVFWNRWGEVEKPLNYSRAQVGSTK